MSGIPDRLAAALADRYRIERELGAGGMATVYLAEDLKHDRRVALKVLRPELAAVIGADRFLAEIRTTANLQHPHILPLFESGTADGLVYYVMPFIQGETVRDRLNREKQLPIADAVRIASEVAAALDYAHRHGVIHRDIKPENILLHDGSALVADFGIALAASKAGDSRMTETGMSLGTPHYMSPEQALGERDITARSDVYALGCVLYEMLLGEPPFTGPTAQSIIAKVMSEKPARLTARRDRIPAEVEDAVLTALEKLPADRFATASEFATALRAPAGAGRSRIPVPKKRRVDWRVAAVAGLVTGAAATAALPRADRTVADSTGGRSQLTFNGRNERPAISPDGEYVAYIDRDCPRGDWSPCQATLFMQGRGSDRPVAILVDVPDLSAPRFTADGLSLVVFAQLDAGRSGLFVIPRLGGVPRRIGPPGVFDTHATADSVLLIPNVARGEPTMAHVIAIASGAVTDTIRLPGVLAHAVGWSPDGHRFAIIEDYAQLTIVARDGAVTDSVRGPFRPTVRWSADGAGVFAFKALPVKEDDLVFFAVDRNGGLTDAPVVALPAIQTLLRGEFDIARTTGQMVLASGSATWDLWTFDLNAANGSARRRTSGTTWYGRPSIAADGSRMFYVRGDAIGDNLYVMTFPDDEEALTAGPDPGAAPARVSADGRHVIFGNVVAAGMRVGIIDLATRQIVYQPVERLNTHVAPAFHAKGLIYVSSDHDGLWLLDPSGRHERILAPPDSVVVNGFVLNPAGDSAALIAASRQGLRLAITPLDRWAPRWVHDFAEGQYSRHLSWDAEGRIYFWIWKAGDDAPGLWQLRSDGAPASLRTILPPVCNAGHIDIAVAAPQGACISEDTRSDIWRITLSRTTTR